MSDRANVVPMVTASADGRGSGKRLRRHTSESVASDGVSAEDSIARRREALTSTFSALFGCLDQRGVAELAGRARIRRFEKGNVLMQAAAGARVHLLLSGAVKWTIRCPRGRSDLVLDVLRAGDVFGDSEFFADGSPVYRATAVSGGEALVITPGHLQEIMLRHSEFSLRWLAVNCDRLHRVRRLVADTVFLDVSERFYRRLLDICRTDGAGVNDGHRFEHGLSQRELACAVGTSRESLNKLLAKWQRRGVATVGRGVLIVHDVREVAGRAK
ncbi:MAG TPA: Crp/Fnr family transcriptional regulator [Candidatus Binatia bacterium]|nr:Crp/Fnr family transcriptional regulator [Candidatus Binatia bacterium]